MAGRPKARAKKARMAALAAIEEAVPLASVGLRPLGPEAKPTSTHASHTGAQAPQSPASGHDDPAAPNPQAPRRTAALGLPVGSDEAAVAVFELTVAGVPAERIAKYIDCTVEELREHHQRQLDVAVDDTVRHIGRALVVKAKMGDVAAMSLILKSHAPEAWDKGKATKVEVSGPGGSPIQVAVKHALIERILAAMPEPKDITPQAVSKLRLPAVADVPSAKPD